MPTELRIRAVHEGGLRMTATNGQHSVTTDYPLAASDVAAGFKPMELLLVSLGTCTGSVVASLLARLHQPVARVEVEARGQRRDEHPTIFTSIALEFVVHGSGIAPSAVEKAIAQADRLCPVWAMLKHAPVTTAFRIVQEPAPRNQVWGEASASPSMAADHSAPGEGTTVTREPEGSRHT